METRQKVREIVEEIVEMEGFDENTKFIELFDMDSMLILEVVSQLEKAFGIIIDEEDYPKFQSLVDIYTVVEEQYTAK